MKEFKDMVYFKIFQTGLKYLHFIRLTTLHFIDTFTLFKRAYISEHIMRISIDFPETKINTEGKRKLFPFPIAEFIRAHSELIRSGIKRNTLIEANLFNERLVSKLNFWGKFYEI